jgi:hypothetical protein
MKAEGRGLKEVLRYTQQPGRLKKMVISKKM